MNIEKIKANIAKRQTRETTNGCTDEEMLLFLTSERDISAREFDLCFSRMISSCTRSNNSPKQAFDREADNLDKAEAAMKRAQAEVARYTQIVNG